MGSEIELEEVNNLIPNFLKRFRLVFVSGDCCVKLTIVSETPMKMSMVKQWIMHPLLVPLLPPKGTMPQWLTSMRHMLLPPKQMLKQRWSFLWTASMHNGWELFETVSQCYTLSTLRHNVVTDNESMVAIFMRLSNKKKFSTKTNDFKAKSLIDFLTSSGGYETQDILLFSRMLGLQPKLTNNISAGMVLSVVCKISQLIP